MSVVAVALRLVVHRPRSPIKKKPSAREGFFFVVHWEYMKVVALYRPNSEFARQVEEFVRDMQRQHGVDERHIEMLDYDSREGAAMASLYDVMTQPTILVIGDDGSYVKSWQGTNLPLMQEVAGYVFSYH